MTLPLQRAQNPKMVLLAEANGYVAAGLFLFALMGVIGVF